MGYSENINFKALSTFHNNVSQDNSISNNIKPNNYGLDKDTVEINKTETTNNNKKSKLLKLGSLVGAGILATTIGLFTHKHISAKNAKKAAEELKKLKLQELEKAKAEEARIAQEKALKAQQEAREKAIQEAKQKAEQEAKIKAEKEAEATRIAKEKAEIKIKDDLLNKLNERLKPSEFLDNDNLEKTDAFSNELLSTLKTAEEKGLKEENVKNLYQAIADNHSLSDSKIESYFEKYSSTYGGLSLRYELRARRDLLQGIESLKQTVSQKENEKYSEYIERLVSTHKTNMATKNANHLNEIRSNIHYSDIEPPKPELTDEELKILQDWNPKKFNNMTKEEALKRLSDYEYSWARGYTSEEKDGGLPENIEHILLSKAMPKYNSQTHLMPNGQKRANIKPVARWLDITGLFVDGKPVKDAEKYIHSQFKVGEKYVAPTKQSCSIDLKSAHDANYYDEAYRELKFIIHPKSSTSKAANIASVADYTFQYGHYEVIYPKGTEFNVLDKRLEDFPHIDGKHHYCWVVEMQEA